MSEPTLPLPRNADELLQEFPATEPNFEAQANAIVARLKGSPGGVVLDDLLKAPELAPEPGEPAPPSSVRAASAPKTNFAEMARKSLQQTDDAKDLAMELLAATAQSRRPNAEMVERVRAAGRPPTPATATPLPTTDSAAEDAQRASGVIARAATTVRPAPANNRGVIIGIAGGLLALAACVALFLRSSGEDERTLAALAAQKAANAPAAAAPPVDAVAPGTHADDGVVSPEALAAAPRVAAADGPKASALKAGGASTSVAAPTPKSAPAVATGVNRDRVVLEDDPAPVQAAPAQHKAEPAPEPQLKPAEGSAGSVPLNPSGGAVSTALNSVRGGAQACLAGQTDSVSAVVTFASDGHVLRVSASGPSAACIQAALSKARLAPFAKESFSATTTIRPP